MILLSHELIIVSLFGLICASLALTTVAVVVVALVSGIGGMIAIADVDRTTFAAKLVESCAPAALGAATAVAVAISAGWIAGL